MSGCPITINNVSGNGVVNVGGAISISPVTASKTVFGAGG
ncbi:UNVERIFIED_CONTAM: spore germination protein, partial [Bacillus amyloliquefaciens DSM 7 = ATCC 23350]